MAINLHENYMPFQQTSPALAPWYDSISDFKKKKMGCEETQKFFGISQYFWESFGSLVRLFKTQVYS
jgi:hypothetical protein